MTPLKIGYCRVSTISQDLSAQKAALMDLGVHPDNIYSDFGLTGTNRERPGLDQALAAVRKGDTLVVTKLDRLARSLTDARTIMDELTTKGVTLSLGGVEHDPQDPMGRLLFNVLGMVAEFESDLIRARTREGMAIAKAAGKLRGKQPKLSPQQAKLMVECYNDGKYTVAEVGAMFGISRATVHRVVNAAFARKEYPPAKSDADQL